MTSELQKTNAFNERLHRISDTVGNLLVDGFHYLALFAIGAAIVWSAIVAFVQMSAQGSASIHDILLLFIYLELGAMVGIYFKTNHMPTRFLIYVGITALVRMLLDDIQLDHEPDMNIVYISGSILLLAAANLVIRYGSNRFPSTPMGSNKDAVETVE
jgi:phosphate starvation-inducible membrane PsiE